MPVKSDNLVDFNNYNLCKVFEKYLNLKIGGKTSFQEINATTYLYN